jgi:ribosomal-protein-alanine N-acetyltransferase
MTEAVRLFQHIAFGPLGLHRLQGAVMTQNTASIRVLIKTGFRCEGYAPRYLLINRRWEDHWIYACLNDAWRSSPNAP